tara:strand:- start:123 stop:1379 length:1257 start_codon:yes stop_codon:yes gene_type:complete
MAKPDSTRQSILSFISPDLNDLFFWEHVTLSRVGPTNVKNHEVYGYGKPHHNKGMYPDHTVVFLKHDPLYKGVDEDSKRYRVYYAAKRVNQDAYNFTWTAADLGGKGGARYDAVSRTYVVLRSDFEEDMPSIGSVMTDTDDAVFDSGMVLASRKLVRIGEQELDSLFVVEQRTYVRRVTITGNKTDGATGEAVQTSESLYYRGEIYPPTSTAIEVAVADPSQWGASSSGESTEAQQLTDNWFSVVTSDIVPSGLSAGAYGKLLRTYYTYENFTWPTVVNRSSFVFTSVSKKNGGDTVSIKIDPFRKQYSGPTKTRYTQYWSSSAVTTLPVPVKFTTRDIDYSGVRFRVNMKDVLVTAYFNYYEAFTIGHAVYHPGLYVWHCFATPMTDWPAGPTIVGAKQEPYRGGFLTTIKEVYSPA